MPAMISAALVAVEYFEQLQVGRGEQAGHSWWCHTGHIHYEPKKRRLRIGVTLCLGPSVSASYRYAGAAAKLGFSRIRSQSSWRVA